jgi:hypothetical protein
LLFLILKKIPKLLLIALCSLAALVVIVELVLHLALPVEPDLGTKIILNNQYSGVLHKINFEVGTDLLRRDGWKDGAKRSDAVRVVCIGGAATVGVMQNASETWWGRLRTQLKKAYPSRKFEFGALGVELRGSRFGAKWATEYLAEFKPDIVIVQYGVEDVLIHPESYEFDEFGMDQIAVRKERKGLKKLLMGWSQIVRRYSRSRQETSRKLQQKILGQTNYYAAGMQQTRARYRELDLVFSIPRDEGKDPIAEYLQSLRVIVGAARGAGARVLLTGEPSLCGEFIDASARNLLSIPVRVNDTEKPQRKPEPAWVEKELYRYYTKAKEYANEARVPFVDLQGDVPQDASCFMTESMLTNKGAEKVADLLLPEVIKLLP